jgi:hypothetical protein
MINDISGEVFPVKFQYFRPTFYIICRENEEDDKDERY